MEQNFQTSFIPKKTIVKERSISPQSVSFSTIVSIFILFSVIVGTGGLYLYKEVLAKNITEMVDSLTLAQNRFEPSTIAAIQTLDSRLNAAKEILANHIAITPIFEELGKITRKTVRYTSFTYSLPGEANGKVLVTMNGIAIGYSQIAMQADLFSKDKNFTDPVFSNLQLDDKGYVTFQLEFLVDPSFVNYKNTLETRQAVNP
ncbi:MAG: hypothetical protein KA515_01485 [Candidatus Pacebacteria bacterium]|nr:hypothetical protein [Candidatus Paceibacterota bacterium]